LAAEETGLKDGTPDQAMLDGFLTEAQLAARFAIGYLR